MEDAIHGAAGPLDRLLERIHRAGDVLFEGIGYEDMICIGIAVIRTCPREVVDPFVGVVVAAGATRSVLAGSACAGRSRCGPRGRLLREKFHSAGYERSHGRDPSKEITSSIDSHKNSPSDFWVERCQNW